MKEIWFWISKDIVELGVVALVMLITTMWFGASYLINKLKRKMRGKKK